MNSLLLTPISCPLPEIATSPQQSDPLDSQVNEVATQRLPSSQPQSIPKKLTLDKKENLDQPTEQISPQLTPIRPNISQCFKDGHFDIIAYDKMVKNYVNNLPKEDFDENLFNDFLSSNIRIPENNEERKVILDSIMKIISTAPGKELIRRIIDSKKPFQIKFGPRPICDEEGIVIDAKTAFKPVIVNNEKRFEKEDITITIAHELIHLLHMIDNVDERDGISRHRNLLPGLDHLEEQATILGFVEQNDLFDPICENTFNKIFGLNTRINHRAITIENFTARDAAHCGALDDLRQMIDENPQLINALVDNEGQKLSLLTIAVKGQQHEVIEYLLSKGYNPNLPDAIGTPLLLALRKKDLYAVQCLVQAGATCDPYALGQLLISFYLVTDNEEERANIVAIIKAVDWEGVDISDLQKYVTYASRRNIVLGDDLIEVLKRLGVKIPTEPLPNR
jgi:hypothetical protein